MTQYIFRRQPARTLQVVQAQVLHIYQRKSLCTITKPQLVDVVKGKVSGGVVGDNRSLRRYLARGISTATR